MAPAPPVPVVLYTRSGCHLCDEMKSEVARSTPSVPFELAEVDVDTDPALAERFALTLPVLEIAGRVAFEGRVRAEDFERALAHATPEEAR